MSRYKNLNHYNSDINPYSVQAIDNLFKEILESNNFSYEMLNNHIDNLLNDHYQINNYNFLMKIIWITCGDILLREYRKDNSKFDSLWLKLFSNGLDVNLTKEFVINGYVYYDNLLDSCYNTHYYDQFGVIADKIHFFMENGLKITTLRLQNYSYELINNLLSNHPNLNELNYSNKFIRSGNYYSNNYEVLEKLKLLKKFNLLKINQQDEEGKTMLMLSMINDLPEVALYLINNDADINIKDNLGNDAMYYSLGKKRLKEINMTDILIWLK